MTSPPVIGNRAETWRANSGQDPAKFLIDPSQMYHSPASFRVGDAIFIFPMTEGFEKNGQAQLGVHHFLGDDFPVVQVTHRGDRRIVLSGTFAGRTSVDNMHDLEGLLNAPSPNTGKKLFVPGVFSNEQICEVESYSFTHASDDQTHSIEYSVTFILTSIGRKVSDPIGTPAPPNPTPGNKTNPKGKSTTQVGARMGATTARTMSAQVYDDPDAVGLLVARNADTMGQDMPLYQIVTKALPLGTQVRY